MSVADSPGAGDSRPTGEPAPTTADDPGVPAADPGTSGVSRPADGVTPGPTSVDFGTVPCPPPGRNADRQVCSIATDLDDAPVVLEPPSPALFEPTTDDESVEMFEFELRNQSAATFGFNPYDWSLERYVDGEWVHVAPEMTPEPWTELAPGERYTYGLAVESVPNQRIDGSRRIVLDLDTGTYALAVDGSLAGDKGRERIESVAIFSIERA